MTTVTPAVRPLKAGKKPKIAVLGDLALDRYIIGNSTRLSSEAPIPVINMNARRTNMACAANTVANLTAMGAKPLMVGRLGEGEYAEEFKKIAVAQDISLNYVITVPEPLTAKTRIVAQNQQIARFDEETRTPLTANIRAQIIDKLKQVREKADIIILSDYGYLTVDKKIIQTVADLWRDGTIIHDPQAFHPINFTGVTALTPNLKEAKFILKNTTAQNTDADTQDLANQLMAKFNLQYVLFTRSEKGMSLYMQDGTAHHVPAKATEVYDVCGAGDSVVAAFTTAIAKGESLPEAMKIANLAGSVAVTKAGVQPISWDEIESFAQEVA